MNHCAIQPQSGARRGIEVENKRAELNRRVQVTAPKSWPNSHPQRWEPEVDSQVAAPTEARTPNLHRANIAHQRVRMEGWRQRRLGSKETNL